MLLFSFCRRFYRPARVEKVKIKCFSLFAYAVRFVGLSVFYTRVRFHIAGYCTHVVCILAVLGVAIVLVLIPLAGG